MTALRERCMETAERWTPTGIAIKYHRPLWGQTWYDRMIAPRPVCRQSLYIYLHECAHHHLGHFTGRKPRHVEEYEAERWTHQKMRESGIPVPRSMTLRAKNYVAWMIEQALLCGAKKIDPCAAKYCKAVLQ
jgi:hypothetical protein